MAGPIEQASQRVNKVTHVSLPSIQTTRTGGATAKANYVGSLNLQPGDVDTLTRKDQLGVNSESQSTANISPALADLLRQYEGSPLPSALPEPRVFSDVGAANLLAFGRALQAYRSSVLASLAKDDPSAANIISQVNTAATANTNFTAAGAVTRIGMLNLERLEMTPAGITRGDLLATIPLAPGETTSVYQKEWSVTSSEFTSIVTDGLENYSETGVTENTNLSQSTTSQNKRNNQYNVTASASGGCGFVSGSVSTSLSASDAASQSATQSRNDAVKTTRLASSRVKQEHKMSISTTTVTGTEQSSTRTLANPTTNAIRIDYFGMMEKWRVRLYRYGLRLTYDLTIPEPGSTLREQYAQLSHLQSQSAQTFHFDLDQASINTTNYRQLANEYGTQVPDPTFPYGSEQPYQSYQMQIPINLSADNWDVFTSSLSVTIPSGMVTDKILLSYVIGVWPNYGQGTGYVNIVGYPGNSITVTTSNQHELISQSPQLLAGGGQKFMAGETGTFQITCSSQWLNPVLLRFDIYYRPASATIQAWQASVYSALFNAAQATYYAQQQLISAKISALQNQIENVDTLTLRREENDEIMKGILRFLLGSWFDFMPQQVISALEQSLSGDKKDVIEHGEAFANSLLRLPSNALSTLGIYGQKILFINEAIEWENLVFFLDSYFWDIPASWNFIRLIQHPDAQRQAFLRAGSARVVVPVRKGYELAWVQFCEGGSLDATLPSDHPYMTIAQEIQDYDNTNYPGIPPANPADSGGSVMAATTSSDKLSSSMNPVEINVQSSAGFITGYTAAIDNGQDQENQLILAVGTNTITVQRLEKDHDGSSAPLSVAQDYEAGLLTAEWNEYTPTSGTDISVNSDLTQIS